MKCFVIQPFDKGRFDKRYTDIYSPAIRDANLEPYRVDQDPNSTIPIEDIENGIRDARICLAEITLDNPNVWFELGFAIAARRPVVMLCSNERESKFPFDVQHRSIIKYGTESPSDYDDLKRKITIRLKAILSKQDILQDISHSVADVEGLSQQELISIAAVAENLETPEDFAPIYVVKRDVESSGFTKMAAMMGLKNLIIKELITYKDDLRDPQDGDFYTGYQITNRGWDWILRNQDKFSIRKPKDIPDNLDTPW